MEKKKNISLDELFARAKREEPVISQEDVRAIVEESPVQSIHKTTSFISRKGFIMSGLGLAGAAALVGYLSLGSGQSPVVSSQLGTPSTQHTTHSTALTPTVEPKKEAKDTKTVKKVIIVRENGDGTQIAIDPNVPEPPHTFTPLVADGKLDAPLEVKGVEILQATETDLPKLGLEKEQGVGLGFFVKKGEGTFKKYVIPEQGWGVMMIDKSSQTPSVVLAPVVITDSRGNKRFVHFADENSMVHMEKYEGDMPGGITITDDHISSNDKNVIIRKGTIADKKRIRLNKFVNKELRVTNDSAYTVSSSLVIDSHDPTNTKEIVVKVDADVDADIDEPMQLDHSIDISIGDSAVKINELVRDAMAKAKIAMKDMKVSLDTTMKNFKKQMSSIMVIDENSSPDDAVTLDNFGMIRMPDFDGTMEAMSAKITAKINTLVPVLVRKATETKHNAAENREYDNGVIMWFDRDSYYKQAGDIAKTYEVVVDGDMVINGSVSNPQQSTQSVTPVSASVLSGASVYPNPVRSTVGKTNVHYTLSEPRTVAFSIHDILGKKVVDCGSLAERPRGTYNFELNAANVPAGIYLVVITTDKGEQSIQRIVIE